MSYAMSVTLDRPFDDVVTDVRDALAGQGFGVVSEIDMQATLRTKLGVEIDRQLILGACNPRLRPPVAAGRPVDRSAAAVQCGHPQHGRGHGRGDDQPADAGPGHREPGHAADRARGHREARVGDGDSARRSLTLRLWARGWSVTVKCQA